MSVHTACRPAAQATMLKLAMVAWTTSIGKAVQVYNQLEFKRELPSQRTEAAKLCCGAILPLTSRHACYRNLHQVWRKTISASGSINLGRL